MRLIIACRAIDNMAGGVERQGIALANEMARRGHQVYLLTFDSVKAEAFYPIEPSVYWHKIGIGNPQNTAGWRLRLKRMKKVRQILKEVKPNVILAFQQGMFLSLRLYSFGMQIPVVAAERESPFRYDFIKAGKYRHLIFQSFRLAPIITTQCESYVKAYPPYLRNKIHVIANAVYPAKQDNVNQPDKGDCKTILCVGRLGYQKNQLVLLDAFSLIEKDFQSLKLMLVGEGDGREEIEKKIELLNLQDKVILKGAIKNIFDLYQQAYILCIPSRWEGFPNVLGEALAHGLPAVGFKGCGGVRDLIQHGKNGLLATDNDDAKSLSIALLELIIHKDKRNEMANNAIESVKSYAPPVIYDQWETFLRGIE